MDSGETFAGHGDIAATQIDIDFKRNIKNEIQSCLSTGTSAG